MKYDYLFELFFINVPSFSIWVAKMLVRNLLKQTRTLTHNNINSISIGIGEESECWKIKTANIASMGISGGKNMHQSHYLCRKCGYDTIFAVKKKVFCRFPRKMVCVVKHAMHTKHIVRERESVNASRELYIDVPVNDAKGECGVVWWKVWTHSTYQTHTHTRMHTSKKNKKSAGF